MYDEFFGFSQSPFRPTSDPTFFYRSRQHVEALENLILGIQDRMGLVSLTGEPGTGKTTTLACLLDYLKERQIKFVFLSYPRVKVREFFEMIASDMDLSLGRKSRTEVFDALHQAILERTQDGRTVVLIVDEAHLLQDDVLEAIGLLGSLENDGRKLLQIVLAGYLEFDETADAPNLRALTQRVALHCHLQRFTLRDAVEYIQFRLERAGMPDQTVFSEELMADVHVRSGGIPRLINTMCDSLLLAAFAISSKVCTAEMLDGICKHLHLERPALEPALPEPGEIVGSAQASIASPGNPMPSSPPAEISLATNAFSTPATQPIELTLPLLKLEPLAVRPATSLLSPAPVSSGLREDISPRDWKPVRHGAPLWMYAVDLWRFARSHLRSVVFTVLLLLGLALKPSLETVAQVISDRAAVTFNDDFRASLNQWRSRGKTTPLWPSDEAGFVQPGQLALYQPTVGLSDYEMQFLGLIDKKALSWVVRATDFGNYYVVKLVVEKQGPLPTIGVTRYAVINGNARQPTHTIVPVNARLDTLYHVRLNVHGDYFTLAVQDLVVDTWSEPLLRHGGVGFFSASGEASRVRWVRVTNQFDVLGRLCASLAQFKMPSTNGS